MEVSPSKPSPIALFASQMGFSSKTRAVAYFDMLGWKAACLDKSQRKQILGLAIALRHVASGALESSKSDAVKEVEDLEPEFHRLVYNYRDRTRIATFSDSVVLSVTPQHFETLLQQVVALRLNALAAGFLTRGGIALGDLYHLGNTVFGPALSDAIQLEQTATFPRLLFTTTALNFLRLRYSTASLVDVIVTDVLGRETLNPCPTAKFGFTDASKRADILATVRNAIAKGITSAASDRHRAEKWRYMSSILETNAEKS